MVLTRSGSAKSTLSTMQRRATRYQKYLTLANILIIITATIMIFNSTVLLKFYFLGTLSFWSIYFWVTPILMMVIGVYLFLLALYGIGITGTESRGLLGLYATLLAIAFVAQLASIYTAVEVRTTIVLAKYGGTNVVKTLSRYGVDLALTEDWDNMQQQMRCCGGTNFLTGYQDYQNTPLGRAMSVPDSCCHEPRRGCGTGVLDLPAGEIRNNIFVMGCLTALKERLDHDVVPMMEVYAGVGVAIALIQLIAIVLTSAYIAQISRRRLREKYMWNALNGEEMHPHKEVVDHDFRDEAARSLNQSMEHETMC